MVISMSFQMCSEHGTLGVRAQAHVELVCIGCHDISPWLKHLMCIFSEFHNVRCWKSGVSRFPSVASSLVLELNAISQWAHEAFPWCVQGERGGRSGSVLNTTWILPFQDSALVTWFNLHCFLKGSGSKSKCIWSYFRGQTIVCIFPQGPCIKDLVLKVFLLMVNIWMMLIH